MTRWKDSETAVAHYLEHRGFSIVARNKRLGHDELDIVASRGRILVFCEVKSRKSSTWADPIEAISDAKLAKMRRAATAFLHERPEFRAYAKRFDAASVTWDGGKPKIEYYDDISS